MKEILCVIISSLMLLQGLNAQSLKQENIGSFTGSKSLGEVLSYIESQGSFTFSYNEEDIDLSLEVNLDKPNTSLYEVLQSLANQAKVQFKQINNSISINKPRVGAERVVIIKAKNISGRVVDESGNEGLPGVTVQIKGTGQGTVTDFDGYYTIEVPSDEAVLIFSFIGYENQEQKVGRRERIDVQLGTDVELLEEVVVLGYGSTLKKDFSGSAVNLDNEQLQRIPAPSTDQVLQGLAAGVQVQANSGTPGGGIKVLIRGQTSINASNDPLYIIDGVPILSGGLGVTYFGGETQSPLVGLNPNDIESISILKDASSTAIYGARAANGVVIITTKRGSSGATRINFSGFTGWTNEVGRLDLLDRNQYIEIINESRTNSGDTPISEVFDPSDPNQEIFDGANEDWLDQVIRTAKVSEYQFNISGGSDKTKLYFSSSYRDQEGIIIGTRLRRGTARFNLGHELTDDVQFNSSLSLSRDLNERVYDNNSSFGPYSGAVGAPPTEAAYNEDGSYNFYTFGGNNGSNPVANGLEGRRHNFTNKAIGNVNFIATPVSGLQFKADFSFDYTALKEDHFEPSFTGAARGLSGTGAAGSTNRARRSDFQSIIFAVEPTITYDKNLGQYFKINTVVGSTLQRSSATVNTFIGEGIPGNDQISYYSGLDGFGSSSKTEYAFNSLFGRVNASHQEKYLASFTLRRDGSSRFGPGNKYGLFWAGSVGWNFSDEGWFDQMPWLTFGKLRTGYGVTGNDQIGDYQFIGGFGAVQDYLGPAIGPLGVDNPNLQWEETSTLDIGLELGLFEERFTINAGYFDSRTKDLLLRQPITGKTGFDQVTGNIGNIKNSGWEFDIGGAPVLSPKFSWNVNFNIALLDNLVTKLVQSIESPETGTVLKEGLPVGAIETLVFKGVNVVNGDAIYDDTNGDGIINSEDEVFVGSAQPDFYGGLNNSISYGAFTLDILFNFSVGQEVFNVGQYILENRFNRFSNYTTDVLDRWQESGDNTNVPRIYNGSSSNTRISSRYVSDGSFVRMRNITLSYELPSNICSKLRLRRLGAYITGSNLITWTNYEGIDPEVNGFAQNTTGPGGVVTRNANILLGNDFLTPPQTQQIIIGLNIGI